MRRALSAPDTFSICLTETHGALLMGATVPTELAASPLWIPYSGSSYSVSVRDLRIDGVSVGVSPSAYMATIVDSGTTFMYLPPAAYKPVRDRFRSKCPWGTCTARAAKGEYPDDYCYTMTLSELDRFASMSIHFSNGVTLSLGPRQYGYELRSGVFCLGIFDNAHNGMVIGAANMFVQSLAHTTRRPEPFPAPHLPTCPLPPSPALSRPLPASALSHALCSASNGLSSIGLPPRVDVDRLPSGTPTRDR